MRAIKRRFLASSLALCLCASPALAAWSVTQKTVTQNAGASTLTTSAISVAQNHLVVVAGMTHGSTVTSVTDQPGNTYTVYACQRGANADYGFVAWALTSTALSSQTISLNAGGVTTSMSLSVVDITGNAASSPEDTAARACNFSNSNSTSPTVTSGSPSQSGDLFASVWASVGSAASFTAGGSWTPSGGYGTGNASDITLMDWLDATGSSSAQTNNPTTSAKVYAMPITAFKAAAPAPSTKGLFFRPVP